MGKAAGLDRLVALGERVPPYVALTTGAGADEVLRRYDEIAGSAGVAVRSSAADEDGVETSQAGRYSSFLDVTRDDVVTRVGDVVASYPHGPRTGDHVILQRMLTAELSGVVFSSNPRGLVSESVVVVGAGAGAGVVDDTPVTTYHIDTVEGRGFLVPGGPELAPALLAEVVELGLRLARAWHVPVDVEWAWADGMLWVLQTRPVTGLAATRVTVDASNIVESYPGLSLPLTVSFVERAYAGVFTSLARRVTRDPRLAQRLAPVLDRMVTASSGRMYYRLDHWYQVMQVMPFPRRYIAAWQDSLGVQDRAYEVSHLVSGPRKVLVVLNLLSALAGVPRGVARLHEEVRQTLADARPRIAAATSLDELRIVYDEVSALFRNWDWTLLNDVHSFVAPALLRAWSRRLSQDDSSMVTGISGIESMRPIEALASLARQASGWESVVDDVSAAELVASDTETGRALRSYLEEFGDRYLEELKLESPTFRTHPRLLVQAIGEAAAQGEAGSGGTGRRHQAQPPRGLVARRLWEWAAASIGRRELSRLDRARVYGMARQIALRAGEIHVEAGHLGRVDDVFWLTIPDVFTPSDHRANVARRRTDYAGYAQLPPYRRLVFAGEPYDVHPPRTIRLLDGSSATRSRTDDGSDLTGTGVSGTRATGSVRVVHDPRTPIEPGEILVTRTTDPGWVFLLLRAGAVVAERGSLLSHTAIVARELGVPVVVGVAGATDLLHDGDRVEVDASRGRVRLLTEG